MMEQAAVSASNTNTYTYTYTPTAMSAAVGDIADSGRTFYAATREMLGALPDCVA